MFHATVTRLTLRATYYSSRKLLRASEGGLITSTLQLPSQQRPALVCANFVNSPLVLASGLLPMLRHNSQNLRPRSCSPPSTFAIPRFHLMTSRASLLASQRAPKPFVSMLNAPERSALTSCCFSGGRSSSLIKIDICAPILGFFSTKPDRACT